MKKNLFMLAALVGALIAPSVSNAAATVWFEYAGGDVAQTGGGAANETLVLEKSNAPGTYTFSVTMWSNVTDIGVFGANTTLLADGPITTTSAVLNGPPNGLPTPANGLGVEGPGPIAVNFGGIAIFGTGYLGLSNMGTFTFEINKTDLIGDINIYAVIGGQRWGNANSTGTQVSFGPNGPVDGAVIGAGSDGLPVITITQVPEPATLSLLGLGAIALIRRRR
ncbi:MAG TPA: PEP-CTERM sorting domain-containing protein [Phycisphaerae bacterium]|nr:PEP-CTERM sorting domain-containing protein [Phycisphaerae bacterium]HRW55451.1 PEP-CTERM sorting domain-containing protein [Phycisphaerae bacterium]